MFKSVAGDVEVMKIIDRFEDQHENIPPLQENGQQVKEHDGQQEKNSEQKQEESLPQPLQEVHHENTPQLVYRSTRPHKPSQRYPSSNYILLTYEGQPNSFQEACKVEHCREWKKEKQPYKTNGCIDSSTRVEERKKDTR